MSAPRKFRKRPVVVEAVQWTGDNVEEVQKLAGFDYFQAVDEDDRGDDPEITGSVLDVLHSTWVGVKTGRWVVKGVKGEVYPIDPEVLAATYEAVDA